MKWIFLILVTYFVAILIEEVINTINRYLILKYGKEDKKENKTDKKERE